MVITFADHVAVTPAGKPLAVPIPVAPVVVCVRFGESAVLIQRVCAVDAVTVFDNVTVMVLVALTAVHGPVGSFEVKVNTTVPLVVGMKVTVEGLAT